MRLIGKNPFISTGSSGTPADVPNASTSQVGKVQLSNAIDSDSQLQASTPLAVKNAITESKTYTDDAIAGLNIQDIIDNLDDHESSLINTEQGLHGVRIWQSKLQQTNDNGITWIDVASNINIVDDLNSTDATSALSANQGNVIKLLIEKLQLDLTNHEATIASDTDYGHIKIDNTTLKYNTDGQLHADIPTVQDGDLTQKGIVQLSNDIIDDDTLSATPKAIFDALVEAKDYTDKVIDDLESTLIKHSFELRPTTQGQIEFDMPPIYNLNPDYYIELLYFNSTKVLESKYLITEKVTGDPTQGYKLVLTSPAPDYNSAVYNLILIGGKALANGTGGTGTVISINNISPDLAGNVEIPLATNTDEGLTILHGTVDNTLDRAITPNAVKQYVDDAITNAQSTLTDDQRYMFVAQGDNVIPIEYADYNPNEYILMLFNNTSKVFKKDYIITTSLTSPSGYEIVLNNPITSATGANFEVVLIYGRSVVTGGSNMNDYIYEGSTPPPNTSLIWSKI